MEMRGNVTLQHIHVSDTIDPPYNHSITTSNKFVKQIYSCCINIGVIAGEAG